MKTKIKTAIIPIAGMGTRFLPLSKVLPKELFPLVDKPILQYIIEEAVSSGIEKIVFVVKPGHTKTLDYFDPASEFDDNLALALKQTDAKFLVVSFTTDWRFAPERSQEIVKALLQAKKQVSYVEIESKQGHDAFLIPIPHYMAVFGSYMKNVSETLS